MVIIIGVYVGIQLIPITDKKTVSLFSQGKDVKIIAHGGAKAMYPENTLYAFEEVMNYPVDVLEVDLHLTKDNYLVGVHDDTIDAYSDKSGNVSSYTYEELLTMNFGYQFQDKKGNYPYRNVNEELKAKLVPIEAKQLLTLYKKKVLYIFEVKDNGERGKKAVKILNDIVKKLHLEKQVCICAFDTKVMEYCLKIKEKDISAVMDYQASQEFVVSNYYGYDTFMDFAFDGMMLPTKERDVGLDNRYLIWKAHKHHKFIYYWTIDDQEEMQRLIDYKVDGIITDRVDILAKLLNRQ